MNIVNGELLVIIDPQKDFISLDGFYAKKHPGIDQILEVKNNINKLLKIVDKTKLVVIYSNYKKDQFGKGLSMCIPGTNGHKIDIKIKDTVTLIAKTEHSCFTSIAFNNYLKDNNIKRIILSGFLAEYCVKQTALDGLSKGYNVSLLSNYIGTGDNVQERKNQLLIGLKEKGAEII